VNYWQFKVPTQKWANDGSDEFKNLCEGGTFFQYIKQQKNKLGDNIGDIVFYYNSRTKASKKYPEGIFLIAKITTKRDEDNFIELELIKDLRKQPFNYQDSFKDMYDFYNTTKKRPRPQPKEQIDLKYNPKALYDSIIDNESNNLLAEELNNEDTLVEGAKKKITVNAYERNLKARAECIEFYGAECMICNFNFEKIYGEIGKNYIHVHHLKPLSEIKEEYEIDPINDLRPVCPNCHAMLHRTKPAYSIEELKKVMY